MGLLRVGDTFFALRFLRLLTTKWTKTGAYKKGIIDANGKVIKKPETADEKSVYNLFHRLVFNVKRLINKVPLVGKMTLASYATALWLIKEEYGLSDKVLGHALLEATGAEGFLLNEEDVTELLPGVYNIPSGFVLNKYGEMIEAYSVEIQNESIGDVVGVPIYQGLTPKGQQVIISRHDTFPT